MPYVNVPNDLSKIKTKIAFNLTKRQLICFGIGAAIGIPIYLLTRGAIGNTGALFVMLGIMLPAFLMAMYERDGLPFEKVLRNMINTKFLRPGIRPYRTQNIYAPFTGKEESISGGLSATRRSIPSIARTGSNTLPAFPNPPRRSCWSAWICFAICALRSILCPKRRAAGWTPV